MDQFNQDINYKNILDYNAAHIEFIKNICKPLNDFFNISEFAYIRLFSNGYHMSLSNSIFQQFYVENDYLWRTPYFREQPYQISYHKSLKVIWPYNVQDELINGLQSLGVYQGFNILRRFKDYVEACFFGTKNQYDQVRDLYTRYPDVLEKFRDYFIKEVKLLLNVPIENYTSVSPYLKDNFSEIDKIDDYETLKNKITSFLDTIHNKKSFEQPRNSIILTPREIECLNYLASGRTLKAIALQLNIQKRTIERHIDNIRNKTECRNKIDLIHWFEDNLKWL